MAGQLGKTAGPLRTPQRKRARADEVVNNAGGYVFPLDDAARLLRFLIIGVDGNTFYQKAPTLATENTEVVQRLMQNEQTGLDALALTVQVSVDGRARSNDPALWVVAAAMASPHVSVRRAAELALPKVARIGTHLFDFMTFLEKHRGWGKIPRRAVGNWYVNWTVDRFASPEEKRALDDETIQWEELTERIRFRAAKWAALQAVKYRQRNGWTHRDTLRLSHGAIYASAGYINIDTWPTQKLIFDFMCGRLVGGDSDVPDSLKVIKGYLLAQEAGADLRPRDAVNLITDYGLPREALPTHVLTSKDVWAALLPGMPATALLRNIPTMTRVGLLAARGEATKAVRAKLEDAEFLKRGRIHPMSVLIAMKTYASGKSVRGSHTWTPVQPLVDGMDAAFYLSFGAVEPTGKATYLALDISGSMQGGYYAGIYGTGGNDIFAIAGITPMLVAGAMALVTANVEKDYIIRGFDTRMVDIPISPRQRLDDVLKTMPRWGGGGTNVSLPFIDATARKERFDLVVSYTDNETWAGGSHPYQALRDYRNRMQVAAKSVVVGMTSTGFSVADPDDAGSLDVVGMDAGTPQIISEFARG